MKPDIISEFTKTMFEIFRSMRKEMSYQNELMHLSALQMQALIFISENKKTSMTDIAEYFHIEMPSATSLLNKLCDQKIVKRHEDENDRRLVIIIITDKGKELLKLGMQIRRKKLEKMLSYFTDKEKKELLKLLKTLNNRIQK